MKKSYKCSRIWLSVFIIAFATLSNGQFNSSNENNRTSPIDQTKAKKINALISKYADYGKFTGTVLVAEKGKIIYKKGFGLANMEWDIPNQTDTKFRIASVTKQFTAMLIMQLVTENKLALDVPISTYLPSYPKGNGAKINIHQLLTHTSGLPNYTSFQHYGDQMRNPIKPYELVNLFADSTLQFTPGERFRYSNSGYVLLGVLIEKVTGKSFAEVLQEKILTPLQMHNTGVATNRDLLKNRAAGYNKNGSTFTNSSYLDLSVAFTAGSMYSTVEDLFLWDQALYTEKLLPQKYLDLIFKKHIPAWREHYGYGWVIGEMPIGNTEGRVQTINHDGGINGFTSLITRIPSTHSSIIFLNNTGGAPLRRMSDAICGILYNKPYDLPKMSLANSLLDVINKDGLAQGLQYFEKNKTAPNFHLDENELNMVSYNLLQSDRAKEAAAVLKLGIKAFPNAFNLYDSYGEVLTALGNKEEAIKNYKQSLALNPKNENGIKMLKKLGVNINKDNLYLLKTADNWTKEIFVFPLNFAKDLIYEGTEEAHFPKGWRDEKSHEFWSYVFTWNINLTRELSVDTLESDLQKYFDGLSDIVNKDKSRTLPKTIAKFHKVKKTNGVSYYTGTLEIFDTFVTNKAMTLNVLVEKHYCKQKQQSILLFKFSPKAFENEIWDALRKIKLRENKCDK